MGHIFSQLGQLFLQALPTAVLVFVLMFILDRLLFRRLLEVLNEREARTTGALERAREQADLAETRAREYEAAFQAVRQEVYRQRETERKRTLAEREAALEMARKVAESHLAKARADLALEVARAKTELNNACQTLAGQIADSLVGNGSGSGRVQ
jgi:F-type H+-transporting ATPase subunit b